MKQCNQIPESFPRISSGEIHLWQVTVACSKDQFAEYKNALSPDELSRMAFFDFDAVRNSYTVSQGALRILLGRYLELSSNLVKIGREQKGKPFSVDDPGLHFNISNSGGLVVLAFSRGGQLGVDIEKIRTLPDLDEMIRKNFTSREQKFIQARPKEITRRFFRFWTIKESYLKAIGEGMRLPPHKLEFSIDADRIRLMSDGEEFAHEDWNFHEFEVGENFVGTLSYVLEGVVIRNFFIDDSKLFSKIHE